MAHYNTMKRKVLTVREMVDKAYEFANNMVNELTRLNKEAESKYYSFEWQHFGINPEQEEAYQPLMEPKDLIEDFALNGMELLVREAAATLKAEMIQSRENADGKEGSDQGC